MPKCTDSYVENLRDDVPGGGGRCGSTAFFTTRTVVAHDGLRDAIDAMPTYSLKQKQGMLKDCCWGYLGLGLGRLS